MISGNGSFSSRFPGKRSASIFAGAPGHCTSITGPHIRSEHRPTDLLGPELSDVDGITEERIGTISVFNGPAPEIRVLKSPDEESSNGQRLASRPQ